MVHPHVYLFFHILFVRYFKMLLLLHWDNLDAINNDIDITDISVLVWNNICKDQNETRCALIYYSLLTPGCSWIVWCSMSRAFPLPVLDTNEARTASPVFSAENSWINRLWCANAENLVPYYLLRGGFVGTSELWSIYDCIMWSYETFVSFLLVNSGRIQVSVHSTTTAAMQCFIYVNFR